MKRIEKTFDVQTGKEIITEREETAEETIQREKALSKTQAKQAEQEAKENARQAVLDKLGLTVDEVAALLS